MLERAPQEGQCHRRAQVVVCILVVLLHQDQVVLPMHQFPQVVPPDSLQCHQEADIRDPTEGLLGPDPCIQVICHFVREMRFFNGSTSTQNGQAEDLGATQATYLGLPMPHRVPWLGQQYQPRAYRVAQRKASQQPAFTFFHLIWVI